jgi:hypothetical protein
MPPSAKEETTMKDACIGHSPARFVVPFSIVGCIGVAFALYAWGGIGPAEQEVIAQANAIRFGGYVASQLPAVEPMAVIGRRDTGAAGFPPRG